MDEKARTADRLDRTHRVSVSDEEHMGCGPILGVYVAAAGRYVIISKESRNLSNFVCCRRLDSTDWMITLPLYIALLIQVRQ